MPEASNDLGVFLRRRRDLLTPRDVGLPDMGRRRAPGLRREEVAALAGVSVDYLVRLEQGRDRNPSNQVVRALAAALRLDADETNHLAKLALCSGDPDLCPSGNGDADTVPSTVQALLDRLEPTPAVVIGPWYRVVASNLAWSRMASPLGILDQPDANLARFAFTDPRAREIYPEWDSIADEQVAVLRQSSIRWRHDERMRRLVDELLAVPEFAHRWEAHDVARRRRGTKIVRHPEAELRIDHEVLVLEDGDQRLITWLPADDVTAEAFERVCGPRVPDAVSPAKLRIVG